MFVELERKKRPPSPPKNRHEWLQRHGYKHWPEEVEETSCLPAPNGILGDLDEIKQDLRDHAGWDDAFLEDVDSRLSALEDKLKKASERFVYELKGNERTADGLRMIDVENATKYCNPDFLSTMKKTALESSQNTNGKTEGNKLVEEAIFPGFPGGVAPLLPGKVEPLALLDLVTRLQEFSGSSLKSWRKIMFSDESISFLQLCFWWLWMEKYKPNSELQSELFTRMARSFTYLIMDTTGRKQDEFFQRYPKCMSQALYTIFCQAFPHSIDQFRSNDFLQWLCNNVYELTSGIPSSVECWANWPMNELDPLFKINTDNRPTTTAATSRQLNRPSKLRSNEGALDRSVSIRQPVGRIRTKDDSPKIGPGPTFESVKFGTTVCTPLLQHQLWVHGLVDTSQLKEMRKRNLIARRQIKEIPPVTVTYSELLKAVSNQSKQRYKEYLKEMEINEQEIQQALTDYHLQSRVLHNETKKLLRHRHTISIEAEKIMAVYSPSQPTKTSTDTNKEDTSS